MTRARVIASPLANTRSELLKGRLSCRDALMEPTKPRVAVVYCYQCQWLLRALWMAGEILSTFQDDIAEVALLPSTSGRFWIEVDGAVIWDRKRDSGFPEIKELKKRIRDRVAPGRDLGHIDRPGT